MNSLWSRHRAALHRMGDGSPLAPTLPQEEVEAAQPPYAEGEPVFDTETIVEEAEQLLRESAPHDYDVLIIGAGAGGCAAALRAAQLGARVGLIEGRSLGGAYLHGCIPLQTQLESAGRLRTLRGADEFGIRIPVRPDADLTAIRDRGLAVAAQMRRRMEDELSDAGVNRIEGRACFSGEHTVDVTDPDGGVRRLTAVHIVIATGSTPHQSGRPGSDLEGVFTMDDIFNLKAVPERVVVVGAGSIGVEFAYLFHEFGAKVTLLEEADQLLPLEEPEIGAKMDRILSSDGVHIRTEASLTEIARNGGALSVTVRQRRHDHRIDVDCVLLADGRQPNTASLLLDGAGIVHENGRVLVNLHCQTSVSGVYAIGDCTRSVGWAHQARAEGVMVADVVRGQRPAIDVNHMPACYYTYPEVASVGLSARMAALDGFSVRAGLFHFQDTEKSVVSGDGAGFVKLVVDAKTNKLLGCHIIGPRATELINLASECLRAGRTWKEMAAAVYAHPSFGETLVKAAAGMRPRHRNP